jgi:hypothetical protein
VLKARCPEHGEIAAEVSLLSPVTVNPDITVPTVRPMPWNPMRVRMRRSGIEPGVPHIPAVLIEVVSRLPHPTRMRRRRRNFMHRRGRGPDAHDDLRIGD